MEFWPNTRNSVYTFKLIYDENEKTYRIDYLNRQDIVQHNYTRAIITSDDVRELVFSSLLNQNSVTINMDKVKVEENKCIEISSEDEISIQLKNTIHLRFQISDIGEYWQIYSIFTDNKDLSLKEYFYIFETQDMEVYDYISSNFLENKSVYIRKDLNLFNIKKEDIIIEDDNKMKLIFNVKDCGTYWEVTNINESELIIMGHKTTVYEVYSWEVYEKIVSSMLDGKNVMIPKDLDSQLSIDDLVISEDLSELDIEKNIAKLKVKDHIYNTRFNMFDLINSVKFVSLVTYFANLGFFITETNREEKYIEIINYVSGLDDEEKSEEIISKFEQYLELISKPITLYDFVSIIDTTCEKIDSSTTVEEVKQILDSFRNECK